MAPYKYPREIECISTLPKTGSDKVKRVVFRQLEKEKKQLETQKDHYMKKARESCLLY